MIEGRMPFKVQLLMDFTAGNSPETDRCIRRAVACVPYVQRRLAGQLTDQPNRMDVGRLALVHTHTGGGITLGELNVLVTFTHRQCQVCHGHISMKSRQKSWYVSIEATCAQSVLMRGLYRDITINGEIQLKTHTVCSICCASAGFQTGIKIKLAISGSGQIGRMTVFIGYQCCQCLIKNQLTTVLREQVYRG